MRLPPNGISIGSSVFAQLIRVSITQRHRGTQTMSVAIGRICAMAMRPEIDFCLLQKYKKIRNNIKRKKSFKISFFLKQKKRPKVL